METLKLKVNLDVKRSMTLASGVKIDVVGMTGRQASVIANNKRLSDFDRGVHYTAAKIRVNDQPVVADDLLDCFTDDDLTTIMKFANNIEEEAHPNE
ncbi:hypothetical protein AGMMS49965_23520 [Bacteroidia bacterium]|nr:hypothetical protein AGMMS49965_23520 [Bacteroidia bacterium]